VKSLDHEADSLDTGPALISLLHALVSPMCLERATDVLGDEVLDNVLASCNVVIDQPRMSRCCRTLALRCASFVITLIRDPSAISVTSVAQSRGSDALRATDGPSPHLTSDVLSEGELFSSLAAERVVQVSKAISPTSLSTDNHFEFAHEVDAIQAFQGESSASWLCGNILLSIKIGSKSSESCGLVELVIRGVTFRFRQVIQLKHVAHVTNPSLLVSIWPKQRPLSLVNQKEEHQTLQNREFKPPKQDDALLADAMSLMEQCDILLGKDVLVDRAQLSSVRAKQSNHPDDAVTNALQLLQQCGDFFDGKTVRTDHLETASLSGDRGTLNDGKRETGQTQKSISKWLDGSLGDNENIMLVKQRLSDIGLDSVIERVDGTKTHADEANPLLPVYRLRGDDRLRRAITVLDRVTVVNTHKIALMYASGNRGDTEQENQLFCVKAGSPEFIRFATGLGKLQQTRQMKYFSGGFDTTPHQTDGEFALVWFECPTGLKEPRTLVVYHAVPFMPQSVNNRKRHVGNDNVHIIFVDEDSDMHHRLWSCGLESDMESVLVSGQFGFVTIFVLTQQDNAYRIRTQLRPELPDHIKSQLLHLIGEDVILKEEAPKFVRDIAVLADIACASVMENMLGPPTNWETRCVQLRNMKRHIDNT